jgi:phage shock protein E
VNRFGLTLIGAAALPALVILAAAHAQTLPLKNPAIDMDGYLLNSQRAAEHRASRLLTEDQFLKMAAELGTLVLDARSPEKYELLHVKGAINLSFPDITVESLKTVIPDKTTRVLIYCNNNFRNADAPFPSKLPTASLNLSTYIALYTYGYRNVYELGPLLDLNTSKLPFASNGKSGTSTTQ